MSGLPMIDALIAKYRRWRYGIPPDSMLRQDIESILCSDCVWRGGVKGRPGCSVMDFDVVAIKQIKTSLTCPYQLPNLRAADTSISHADTVTVTWGIRIK